MILLKFFCRSAKLFGCGWGFIGRPTQDRLVTLRQTSWFSPRGECEEAGRPGPPPLFLCFCLPGSFELVSQGRGRGGSRLQDPPSKNLRVGHPPRFLRFLLRTTSG